MLNHSELYPRTVFFWPSLPVHPDLLLQFVGLALLTAASQSDNPSPDPTRETVAAQTCRPEGVIQANAPIHAKSSNFIMQLECYGQYGGSKHSLAPKRN